jgi:hypothetical protein
MDSDKTNNNGITDAINDLSVADQRKFHSLESATSDFMLPVGGNIVELQQMENHLAQNRHHNEELSMKLKAINKEQDKIRMLEQRVSELKFYKAEFQSQVEEKSAAVSAVEKNDKKEILEIKQNAEMMIAQSRIAEYDSEDEVERSSQFVRSFCQRMLQGHSSTLRYIESRG